jgi:hypothetical protein
MSSATVAPFMQIMISIRSRRARKPSLLRRMLNQVGRPWMLLGKRFLPVTGMPILYNERINMLLLVWLPEPLAVATLMLKSLTMC